MLWLAQHEAQCRCLRRSLLPYRLWCHDPACFLAGDYWPGEAENLLNVIMEESRVAGKRGGGAAAGAISGTKGGAAARGKTSKGKRGPAGSADEALMSKMGETIQVENFHCADLPLKQSICFNNPYMACTSLC